MGRSAWARGILALALVGLVPGGAGAADLPGEGADAGKTVVYRDTWGVPHIYAPTMEAGVYAQGWAQAQDRPHELLKNLKRALGEWAELDGPQVLSYDLVARVWDHYGTAQRNADRIAPEVRAHIRAFTRGIRDFYAAHPEDVPDWWGDREVDEYMLIAFGRLFLYAWSIEQTFGDLRRAGIEPGLGEYHHGSNQWAVAPARSAEGAAILLIDPHLSWWGMSRFWEFRVHAGEWHGSGVTIPAFPYIGLGHTNHLAWAMTTGGPDTADVYELTLKADEPHKYLYDGQWREMTPREITIAVKDRGLQTFTIWDAHYGPVIAQQGGKAYAAKTAYADSVGTGEAWHLLNTGTDYTAAKAALAGLHLFPQNVMVADTAGNIYYQRTGRVPRRPEGFDWSRPVNGSTSVTEWQGFHPADELVQLLNPPQGYMQNCNIPPDVMLAGSPLTIDRYPDYLYSDASYGPARSGWTNHRGARAVELLSEDDAVTAEEARTYAVDVKVYGVERWLAAVRQADAQYGALPRQANPNYAEGIKDLLAWDGELRRDSTGALKYYYVRRALIEEYGADAVAAVAPALDGLLESVGQLTPAFELTDDQLQAAVNAVVRAMTALKNDYGRLDVTFGDKFRVGRDDTSWPVGGSSLVEVGMRTLRSVGPGPEREDGTRWGHSGQTSTQVVVLGDPVRSWSYVPIGQSDRPESPHYRDQAERLFSTRTLKPTWYAPAELAGHIESRTVLESAP